VGRVTRVYEKFESAYPWIPIHNTGVLALYRSISMADPWNSLAALDANVAAQ